jgi:hypothetical protein
VLPRVQVGVAFKLCVCMRCRLFLGAPSALPALLAPTPQQQQQQQQPAAAEDGSGSSSSSAGVSLHRCAKLISSVRRSMCFQAHSVLRSEHLLTAGCCICLPRCCKRMFTVTSTPVPLFTVHADLMSSGYAGLCTAGCWLHQQHSC